MASGLDGGVGRISSNDHSILPRVTPDRNGLKNQVSERHSPNERRDGADEEELSKEKSSGSQEQLSEDEIQELTDTLDEDDHEIDCLA